MMNRNSSLLNQKSQRGLLPLIFLILSASGATIGQLGAVASWISNDLSLSKSQMGITQTCFYIGSLMGAVIAKKIIDRFSIRRVYVSCLFGMALGAFLCSTPNFSTILMGRSLTGVFFSSVIVLCTSIMAVRYESQKTILMSLVHATVGGSVALTLFFGQWVGEQFGTWSALFWISGAMVMGVACLALIFDAGFFNDNIDKTSSPNKSPSFLEILFDLPLMISAMLVFGYLIIEQSLTVFLQVWAIEVLQATATEGASIAGALWLGVIAGRLFSASVISEERSLQMLSVSGIFCALCIYMLSSSTSIQQAITMVFVSGFWAGPLVPLTFAFLAKETALPQISAASYCQVSVCLGGLVGPFLVGLVSDTFSLQVGIQLASALLTLCVFPTIFLWIKRALTDLFPRNPTQGLNEVSLQGR